MGLCYLNVEKLTSVHHQIFELYLTRFQYFVNSQIYLIVIHLTKHLYTIDLIHFKCDWEAVDTNIGDFVGINVFTRLYACVYIRINIVTEIFGLWLSIKF